MKFSPIVEFFPVMDYDTNTLVFHGNARTKRTLLQQAVRKQLENARGVYAFYNSEAEIIYVGKAERQSLFKRMKQSLDKERTRYHRYYVEHGGRNVTTRKIVRKTVALWQVAEFFSAYQVEPGCIKPLEQLIIRMIPNDLINARIEGNGTLKALTKGKKLGAKSNG